MNKLNLNAALYVSGLLILLSISAKTALAVDWRNRERSKNVEDRRFGIAFCIDKLNIIRSQTDLISELKQSRRNLIDIYNRFCKDDPDECHGGSSGHKASIRKIDVQIEEAQEHIKLAKRAYNERDCEQYE